LFSLTIPLAFPFCWFVFYGLLGFFNFAVSQCKNGLGLLCGDLPLIKGLSF